VQDNCGESGETNEAGNTYSYDYDISAGDGGTPQLVLTDPEGDEINPFEPR
jgi:hypothetical protein